jgi:hypothetical protein
MNKITRDETEHGVEYVRADEAQAEVLEQCRINGMGAEREDALRAELTRLKASIALDKKADNARELGLDYEPAVQEGRDWSLLEATQESLREHMAEIKRLKAAQPEQQLMEKAYLAGFLASADGYNGQCPFDQCGQEIESDEDWCIDRDDALRQLLEQQEQEPVAPKLWVNLTDEEMEDLWAIHSGLPLYRAIEAKLKGKNHG